MQWSLAFCFFIVLQRSGFSVLINVLVYLYNGALYLFFNAFLQNLCTDRDKFYQLAASTKDSLGTDCMHLYTEYAESS